MKFTKMHGIGNDYVYVNCFEETVADPVSAAKFVSDRHYGIGSDGLILIKPSDRADCEMDMYNLDGSRGKMCGNGIRCVAKYVYDHGIVPKQELTIDTASGLRHLRLTVQNGKAEKIQVNMGPAILKPADIPVDLNAFARIDHERDADAPVVNRELEVMGQIWQVTAVSMGNPHAIIFTEDPDRLDLPHIGPAFEHHPAFPELVNTEFIQVLDRSHLKMRVWERGSGETMACGTGACAAAVAAILNGAADESPVTVHLRGGDLEIDWDRGSNTVYMTGPATEVFHGEIELP